MSEVTFVRTLRQADLEPLAGTTSAPVLVRPSRSYWQDAWLRLKANRRALVSLYIVIGLLLFAFAGPLVWRVDPALQDVDQISIAPGADRTARIVAPYQAWDGVFAAAEYANTSGLRLAAEPTTLAVRLQWDAVDGGELERAAGYRVYRNHYPIAQTDSLGLPLADIVNGSDLYYE